MNFIGDFTKEEKEYVLDRLQRINIEDDGEGMFIGDISFLISKNDDGTINIKKVDNIL